MEWLADLLFPQRPNGRLYKTKIMFQMTHLLLTVSIKREKKGKTPHFFFYLLSPLCSNYSNFFPMFTILFTDIRRAYLYVFPHFIAVISTLINIAAWIGRKYESSLRFYQEKEHFFIAFI